MSRIIYNISIFIYHLLVRLASLFSPKARNFIRGRKNLLKNLQTALKDNSSPIAWFHCASLGEFEQGRPLIESFKKEFPYYKILLTFFSPSGYEVKKNYPDANWVYYLPLDYPSNARRFIEITSPKVAFIIKYEYWYNILHQAHKKNIPIISASSIFRQDQLFFKGYGKLMRKTLSFFIHFFVQDELSVELLKTIGINSVKKTGDTRFDRVRAISKHIQQLPVAEAFSRDNKVFIVGSCWPQDMEVLLPFMNENRDIKFIIAPHTMEEKFFKKMEVDIQRDIIRFSKATPEKVVDFDVLLIDNIGMLSSLYQYGRYAYVGGAFGQGLHNILEPATFGLPVFFGSKNYKKFKEARDLTNYGGAFAVDSYSDFIIQFRHLQDSITYRMASEINSDYVENNTGATDIIINYCKTELKL